MSATATRGEYRSIELHLIDPPELAMRENFGEEELMALADDIREVGLIQPMVVRPVGARFQIIAGHRRFVALNMIEAVSAPCIVRTDTDIDFERLKVAENAEREDVNPAHEARYFARLLVTRCGDDTDRLSKLVNRSREYVETRLLLLKGDERILAAVADKRMTLSVARELNGIRDSSLRAVYIESAVKGGCSGRQAREWRLQANGFADQQQASAADAGAAAPTPTQPIDSVFRCICCKGDDDVHLMKLVYVHDGCLRAVLRPLLGQTPGGE